MKDIEILKLAYSKIVDKQNWTQRTWSLDSENRELPDPRDRRACRWCATGAVLSTADWLKPLEQQKEQQKVITMLGYVASRLYPETWYGLDPRSATYRNMIVEVNDVLGYDAVMKVFQTTQEVLENGHPTLDVDHIRKY